MRDDRKACARAARVGRDRLLPYQKCLSTIAPTKKVACEDGTVDYVYDYHLRRAYPPAGNQPLRIIDGPESRFRS